MNHPSADALYFDDVAVGQTWESATRTVAEADVFRFAELTGDCNPLHLDKDFAKTTPFGQPIAHGLLGLSMAAGLASTQPRMRTLSFLKIVEWNFLKPIYFGDALRVVSRVLAKEPRSRGRRGVVTWNRQILNQDGIVVQEGTTQTLVEGRGQS